MPLALFRVLAGHARSAGLRWSVALMPTLNGRLMNVVIDDDANRPEPAGLACRCTSGDR